MEFFNLLYHDDLKNAVILVLANKIDLPSARDSGEIAELFALTEIKDHEWHVQGCCALTGQGLDDGLDWLTTKLNQKTLNGNKLAKSNVTKLPDHGNQAILTNLTIGGSIDTVRDLEASGVISLKKAK